MRGWTDAVFDWLGVEPQRFYSFDNIHPDVFLEMVDEGLIPADNFDDSQNGAPTFMSILTFNDGYGKALVGVGGYIVGKERQDERVTITSVKMEPGYSVPSMISLGVNPDTIEIEDDKYIYMWWD